MPNEKEILKRAERKLSTIMQIEVQQTGDAYIAFMYGNNISSHSAFGDSPEEAINNVIKLNK